MILAIWRLVTLPLSIERVLPRNIAKEPAILVSESNEKHFISLQWRTGLIIRQFFIK